MITTIPDRERALQAQVDALTEELERLRHSTAIEMINAGIALNTVGEVLGHRSAASTRRYAHLQTAALKGALATVGRKAA